MRSKAHAFFPFPLLFPPFFFQRGGETGPSLLPLTPQSHEEGTFSEPTSPELDCRDQQKTNTERTLHGQPTWAGQNADCNPCVYRPTD